MKWARQAFGLVGIGRMGAYRPFYITLILIASRFGYWMAGMKIHCGTI